MKKKISILLAVALLISVFCITGASAAATSTASDTSSAPSVRVNDLLVRFPDTQPYIDSNNRTMIPVRFVTEALGAEVSWDQDTQTAVIALDGTTVKVPIGSKTITVTKDGSASTVTMDTQAVISGGRTCIPIRFVAEAIGAYVGWSSYYNVVEICKETLSRDDIIRLRSYGYVLYPGSRYTYDSGRNLIANSDASSLYGSYEINKTFFDPNYGFDNAREYLLRFKYPTQYAVYGKLTGKTWKTNDENQARLYINEGVALVNQYWSCDGITANFVTDTSCMYQDDYYDGFNYSLRGVLHLTVTNANTSDVKSNLNALKINYINGQSEYAVDLEAKISRTSQCIVKLSGCYLLAYQNK